MKYTIKSVVLGAAFMLCIHYFVAQPANIFAIVVNCYQSWKHFNGNVTKSKEMKR